MLTGAIETFSGRMVEPLRPNSDDIALEDIARSLSMQCRFNGHCARFYSVAEHSVNTAEVALRLTDGDSMAALFALLHDASEAYLCDLPRPIKSAFPNYLEWEKRLSDMIFAKFAGSLPDAETAEVVRRADDIMLATEAAELTSSRAADWGIAELKVDYIGSLGISPPEAEKMFLDRFREITHSH